MKSNSPQRFLIRHLGNMGDMVFFIPPVLETLKKTYPHCHITFVTAWGYKESRYSFQRNHILRSEVWGKRNQSGFSIHLMMTNPHLDQLVHYHDTLLDLEAITCREDGVSFPTWSKEYYEEQKTSGAFDAVWELDFGIGIEDNPLQKIYASMDLPADSTTNYQLYLTDKDREIAAATIKHYPKPRIALLEGLEGTTTRGWDPGKISALETAIRQAFRVDPIWFGGKHTPYFEGRPLTLRENIARLTYCDAAIGVLSGPLHFAAAVGLPTITLYGDQPLHRAAPSFFLNSYINENRQQHRTLLGPSKLPYTFLKDGSTRANLTPAQWQTQQHRSWTQPGRQSTKSCLAVITVDEIMMLLKDMLQ